ncbi:MAG: T9SS type A sorting domain-containing protein [Bacteroidales bacterium]
MEFSESICQGHSFYWEGTDYTTPGDYTMVLQSTFGCDSIVTLHLSINPTFNEEFSESICQGHSFYWEGTDYTTPGDYTKVLQSTFGCDSTVTLHLSVNPTFNEEFSESICQGHSFYWEGTDYTTQGDYTRVLQSTFGCDSTVTLHLSVNPTFNEEFSESICQGHSFYWEGTNYTIPGDYTRVLQSTFGCDSTVTLHLSVNPTFNEEFSESICQGHSFYWEGTDYTTPGDYTKVLQSTFGCDSTVKLHLSVNPLPTVSITQIPGNGQVTLDAGYGFSSYLWTPETQYTQTIIVTKDGTYSVLVTNQLGCEASTSTNVTITNSEDIPQQFVKVYPNPVKDKLSIEISSIGYVEIINTVGVVVLQKKIESNDTINMIDLHPGIYLVKILKQGTIQPVMYRIVKF